MAKKKENQAKEAVKAGLENTVQFKIKYKFDHYRATNPEFDLKLDGYVYFAQK